NWTETGHRVTLVAARRSTELPYAEIAVPLVLEADQPATLDVQLRLDVRGKLRADWPSEWPDIEPGDPFRIYPHDWRKTSSSGAVIAPRRFGKSTLVEYLVREGRTVGLAIPPALWCTAFASSGGFDYERLWNEASSELSKLLGAPLGMGRTGFLPDGDAFDHVRRRAGEQGFKAVVLL